MSKGKLWYSCPLCSKRRGYPNFRCVHCDRYHCSDHVEFSSEHDGYLCRRCARELASAAEAAKGA